MDIQKNPAARYIETIKSRIAAVLPRSKDVEIYTATVIEYIQRNPDLLKCEKFSLDTAILDAAMLGFELGAPFDLAAIIPFKDRDHKVILASMVIEYRGHMMRVYASGKVKAIEARAVYEADDFEYAYGHRPVLQHQLSILPKRGQLTHAYAIAQLTDGGTAAEVITQHDADRARADSPTGHRPDSLWNKRPAEMWTKTAIKKLVNRLPRAPAPAMTGPDPPQPKEYAELINAVLIAPDTYKQVLSTLPYAFPVDSGSIRHVLELMRQQYRSQSETPKESCSG